MKSVFFLVINLTLVFTSAFATQEEFAKELFETDVHPFLVRSCSECHSEQAVDPIGPPHSHSDSDVAFGEFFKKIRLDNITRSSMWLTGTNGHYCVEFNYGCDEQEAVTEELKEVLTKYASDIESAFPSEETVDTQASVTSISTEQFVLSYNIANDVRGRPVKLQATLNRLPDSDYVQLESLNFTALEGFFRISGIEFQVNGVKLQKDTGYENVTRDMFLSENNGIDQSRPNNDYPVGYVLGPFKPIFRMGESDQLTFKVDSIKQLRESRGKLCDILNLPTSQTFQFSEFGDDSMNVQNSVRNLITGSAGVYMESFRNVVTPSENYCKAAAILVDSENASFSPFFGVSIEPRREQVLGVNQIVAFINKYDHLIDLTKDEENIYAELMFDENSEAIFTDPLLSRGQYLYNVAGCVNCHGANLSGGIKLQTPGGEFSTPNISSDSATGIGEWELHNFSKAIREGEAPDGSTYYPAFPYTSYRNMNDFDIEALFSYLMEKQPVVKENEDHSYGFKTYIPFGKSIWRWWDSQADFIDELLSDPVTPIEKGAYTTIAVMHCAECHTPRSGTLMQLKYDSWMEGGEVVSGDWSIETAPPLTDMASRGWDEESYKLFLRTGETPKGMHADGKMIDVIENQTSKLSDQELDNVVQYLLSL